MKQYIIPFLLILTLLFAFLTDTISIKHFSSNNNQISSNQTFDIKPDYDHEASILESKPPQQLSGELLISSGSWPRRSQIIGSSKGFLNIWMYDITHRESRALIKSLAKQGVKVRMILEDDKFGIDRPQDPRGRGIQVQNDGKLRTNFMHAKVLLSEDFYIIQTANLGFDAFNRQREYYVHGNDPAILANLKFLFEKDWKGEAIKPEDIHPNLIVCPIDCREKISGYLKAAKKFIYTENQYLQDPEIISILQSQHNLDLKIILPKDEKNRVDAPGLESSTRLLTKPYIHAKAILIDETYLIISSINFSENSLDNNREIGIIVTDPGAIQKFQEQFRKDWQQAK